MSKWCVQKHKVEFWECDPSVTVHNSKYFIWFERARFLIAQEIGLEEVIKGISGDRIYFPVIEAECKYIRPIPLDADLIIRTRLKKPKVAKLFFEHIITDEKTNEKYAQAVTIVGICSEEHGLILTLSDDFKEKLDNYFDE